MLILGIDPGLNATGYGIVAGGPEGLRAVAAGVIRPPHRQPLSRRLHQLYEALSRVIDANPPEVLVLESVFVHHQFLTTAALMAHARGVVCLLAAQRGLSLIEYLPTRIKKALTGHGQASKEQVAGAVGMWLGFDAGAWPSDTTDALGIAIAHAHIAQGMARNPQSVVRPHRSQPIRNRRLRALSQPIGSTR